MSQIAEYDQMDNPYRSTATFEPTTEVTETELRAFVGPRGDYYMRKWAPRLEDPNDDCGMNWAAFFLTAFWLAYRKMYGATFIFYGVVTIVAILEQVVFVGLIGGTAVPGAVGLIINVVVCLVCGLYGNAWYLNHTRRKIADAYKQGLRDEPLLYHLVRRGGTSLAAAFGIPFLLSLVMGLLLAFVIVATIATRAM